MEKTFSWLKEKRKALFHALFSLEIERLFNKFGRQPEEGCYYVIETRQLVDRCRLFSSRGVVALPLSLGPVQRRS